MLLLIFFCVCVVLVKKMMAVVLVVLPLLSHRSTEKPERLLRHHQDSTRPQLSDLLVVRPHPDTPRMVERAEPRGLPLRSDGRLVLPPPALLLEAAAVLRVIGRPYSRLGTSICS